MFLPRLQSSIRYKQAPKVNSFASLPVLQNVLYPKNNYADEIADIPV